MQYTIKFEKLGMNDVGIVGGKNASLGEMIQHLAKSGVTVPTGFATTADAYRDFLTKNQLDTKIYASLAKLDIHNLSQLKATSNQIRKWIIQATFPKEFIAAITDSYKHLAGNNKKISFAVRSSATAEDLPQASFAGQQDTFLNIRGIDNVMLAIKKVFASLFNERAIVYRVQNNFAHPKVAISAGIQQMIRSDIGSSGVMFTLDTESGFDKVVFINSSYGLGEAIVQGIVNPDEFYVYKPSLEKKIPAIISRNLGSKNIKIIYSAKTIADHSTKTVSVPLATRSQFSLNDADIETLGRNAIAIEKHYKKHMDIEWAKDGIDGKIYIIQARPETVKSLEKHTHSFEQFYLEESATNEIITQGHSVGQKIGQGNACVITATKYMKMMKPGMVLVADMTDPDWEPIMKLASAIVTNRGGRTCHAAIVARELGIPAVVGCNNATTKIKTGEPITVSCASGESGYVYRGLIPIKTKQIQVDTMPKLPVRLCLNMADPDKAFTYQYLPNDGVGLVRIEFIISNTIGIHPNALLHLDKIPLPMQRKIKKRTVAYKNPTEFYIEKLREGVSTIAAAFYPKPIIIRFSDFKSNEYANLLGGNLFEPHEENPMIGFRGGSRYVSKDFADCFALECEAMKRIYKMGLNNVQLMLPFVRTVDEAKKLIELLASHGLKRDNGNNGGVKIILMCEIPSNALLADDFLELCDGFSVGSNDLTQLTLGLDRDSNLIAYLFDERNKAVKTLLHMAITACNKHNKYIGICGQGPSDYPDFAKWLLEEGIGSMSLSPDSIVETWLFLAKNLKTKN